MAYEIRIENFEGPLDLLLHLIKKNEMDIYNIQVAEITRQYLEILDTMQVLNLDVAGEFLLMAATLLHIKSRFLLPLSNDDDFDEEELDPRAELVRRLLEYQKYKAAGETLNLRPHLSREIFARKFHSPDLTTLAEQDEGEVFEVGLFELVEAFQRLLKETSDPYIHEVHIERISVTDRVNAIMELLTVRKDLNFSEIFSEKPGRQMVVVTFLALLELVRLRLVRLMQNDRCGNIWLYPAVSGDLTPFLIDEDQLGYI